MTEDDVRRIVLQVLDEIAVAQQAQIDQANARRSEEWAQYRAERDAQLKDDPDDGPFLRKLKATLRGEEES